MPTKHQLLSNSDYYRPRTVDTTLIVKFLHVLLAMALVTGLVGRWIANAHAERSMDIGTTDALLEVS